MGRWYCDESGKRSVYGSKPQLQNPLHELPHWRHKVVSDLRHRHPLTLSPPPWTESLDRNAGPVSQHVLSLQDMMHTCPRAAATADRAGAPPRGLSYIDCVSRYNDCVGAPSSRIRAHTVTTPTGFRSRTLGVRLWCSPLGPRL